MGEDAVSATSLAGAGRLGLAEDEVRELVELRDAAECAGVQQRMAELVGSRLADVQSELDAVLTEQAAAGGVGGGATVEPLSQSIPLAKAAGRLQAAADILAAPAATGGCTEDCACTRAASVTDGAFVFTTRTVAPQGQPIQCTLDADGGDMAGRLGEWQTILGQATGREEIDEGIAVTFGHDIARTAELARLLAAEYSCCSFASYHLVIDARGVRMEVHAPPEARPALAAVFGATTA
jgi:hypothetical protein